MGLIGALGWMKVLLLIFAQLLAAICAAAVVSGLFPGPLSVNTTLSRETSVTRGLFIEMFLTFMLIFTIFMLAAEKHRATFIAPVGIGMALWICEMAGTYVNARLLQILTPTGVYYTGGSLNPARSFGPAVITGVWPGHHWVYWVGPLLGAILAVVFYRLMKMLEYETANPGADHDGRDIYQEHGHDHSGAGTSTRYETAHTSTSRPLFLDTYPDLPTARQATDGADERDFAAQLQSGARQPARIQRQVMPSMTDATTVSTTTDIEKPATPMPVHMHGMDGHRDTVNHPDDRPRAHHQKRSSSQYEMASDSSYRHGPSAESGSSES
jgi:aquaporin related protein